MTLLFLLLPLNWSNLAFLPNHYGEEINGHVGHIDTSAKDPINHVNFSVCVELRCVTNQMKPLWPYLHFFFHDYDVESPATGMRSIKKPKHCPNGEA